MELKVVCQCGQKFKFDVEPVNGQMPFTVNCPVCNQDGTATANAMLAEIQANPPPPLVTTAPPPAPSATPPSPGGLRISRSNAQPPQAATPTENTEEGTPDSPGGPIRVRTAAAVAAAQPKKAPSFGMGLLGGFIGALVGIIIYFLIFKFTGMRIKLLAIGVGALAGWLAELLGKGEGSKELGVITAALVLAGIVGAQYFVALGMWHDMTREHLKESAELYDKSVAEAAEVVKAIPTGSDKEIRLYLAQHVAKAREGDAVPGSISDTRVKYFRTLELPMYQELASGRVTREQFNQGLHLKTSMTKDEQTDSENTFKGIFLLLLLSKMNLFSLAGAAGLAFKLCTNA